MNAIVFDTETTGFVEPDVIELAYTAPIRAEHYVEKSPLCFNLRFKPTKPITNGAKAVHGIIDEELSGCPAWPGKVNFPKGTEFLIGHNVDFDWQAIGSPPLKRICTCAMSRVAFPTADSHSLAALMFHLFPDRDAQHYVKNAHTAMADVIMTWALLCFLLKHLFPGEFTWERVWEKSEICRVPTVMTFGKHKGEPMAKVPRDYKQWLLRQPDVDPYLRKALEAKPVAK